MSYYDSDLKAVLARFHNHPDTHTRKDILKKLSDSQLSRVVIQGVKCEFEREGLEEIALVMLGVISRDPRSKVAPDVQGKNEVAVKDEEVNRECEVMIKLEELDDDNGITMMRSKLDDNELAPTPGPSMIASVPTSPSPELGRRTSRVPRTKHKAGRRVEAHYSKWKRDRDAAQDYQRIPKKPRLACMKLLSSLRQEILPNRPQNESKIRVSRRPHGA